MRSEDEFLETARQFGVPEHTAQGFANYVFKRVPPGGFVTAVLSNNMKEAFLRADAQNKAAMEEIVSFLYMAMPTTVWGSVEIVRAHLVGDADDEKS